MATTNSCNFLINCFPSICSFGVLRLNLINELSYSPSREPLKKLSNVLSG